jgi:hypothetical protein
VPEIGWSGVFKIAIAFDLISAVLAFFVLRKMRAGTQNGRNDHGGGGVRCGPEAIFKRLRSASSLCSMTICLSAFAAVLARFGNLQVSKLSALAFEVDLI